MDPREKVSVAEIPEIYRKLVEERTGQLPAEPVASLGEVKEESRGL